MFSWPLVEQKLREKRERRKMLIGTIRLPEGRTREESFLRKLLASFSTGNPNTTHHLASNSCGARVINLNFWMELECISLRLYECHPGIPPYRSPPEQQMCRVRRFTLAQALEPHKERNEIWWFINSFRVRYEVIACYFLCFALHFSSFSSRKLLDFFAALRRFSPVASSNIFLAILAFHSARLSSASLGYGVCCELFCYNGILMRIESRAPTTTHKFIDFSIKDSFSKNNMKSSSIAQNKQKKTWSLKRNSKIYALVCCTVK